MRRLALIGLPLLLAGCNYVGSPYDGFGGFLGDVHNFELNPNKPVGGADNMRRVSGDVVDTEPLMPEAGNIWPGPLPPPRNMFDLQNAPPDDSLGGPQAQPPGERPPGQAQPRPRGSSTPDFNPGAAAPRPANPQPRPNAAIPPPLPPLSPTGRTLQTPNGPASTIQGGNGVETFIQPGGRSGVVINNGNGTSTLLGTDGSTITVPATR
jgi:hypothetical protein